AGLGLTATEARAATGDLVRAGLVRTVESGAGRRFTMLNTVRAVAATDLAPDRDGVVAALADHWVARAREVDPMTQPGPQRLESARAELVSTQWVLDHLTDTGRADEAALVLLAD